MRSKPSVRTTSRRVLVVLLSFLSSWVLASAQRRERTVDSWKPTHYEIALTLDEKLTELTRARAEISLSILKGPLSSIDLDFGAMTVDSVSADSAPARFEQRDGRLNVHLSRPAQRADTITIAVDYHGRPKDGLVLTTDKAGKPSATGDNWPDRTHHWIPCLDHPSANATVTFKVTAPAREIVVANGRLVATRNDSAVTRTWTYVESRPIPPYCMIIAVGEYAVSKPPSPAVTPLEYYVPQTDKDVAVQGFSAAPASLSFFSQTVAPYPYEKLALIVGATRFGGMENSSAIVFGSTLFGARIFEQPQSATFKIRRGLAEVIAHEVAHQWFGDSVAIRTWSDLWLSEGFATYFAGLFIERFDGSEAFRDYMQRGAKQYFTYERGRRAPIYDRDTTDLFKLLNPNNYQKGSWVLHMLRGLLGDKKFFKGIREYYRAHQNATATTEDLRSALERASGMDLKEFFARWVYASGHPRYEVAWTWNLVGAKRGLLELTVRQTQSDAAFLTPLPVEIVSPAGAKRVVVKPSGKETVMRIPTASRPTDVRIDPDEIVLKEVVVKSQN